MVAYIYFLRDPETSEVRYVGQTFSPEVRKKVHLAGKQGSSKNKQWVNDLSAKGKQPIFEIVEKCDPSEVDEKEILYIKKYKTESLLNVMEGGSFWAKKFSLHAPEKTSKRLNFHIEDETVALLRANMKSYGHTSIASFLRFIIIDFLRKNE